MHHLYRSFAGQLVATQIALALALCALLAIAALIEGRTPGISQNLPLILPVAGSFGAFWTLCQWRREGGDLGLYCCGRSPKTLILLMLLITLPWFAVSGPHRDHFQLNGNQLIIDPCFSSGCRSAKRSVRGVRAISRNFRPAAASASASPHPDGLSDRFAPFGPAHHPPLAFSPSSHPTYRFVWSFCFFHRPAHGMLKAK